MGTIVIVVLVVVVDIIVIIARSNNSKNYKYCSNNHTIRTAHQSTGEDYVLGTQICSAMLREYNVTSSLVCIRSGNTSPDDTKDYVSAGVHCVICKSYDNTSLKEPLLRGYELLQEERMMIDNGTMKPN